VASAETTPVHEVAVLTTEDFGKLPLARMALEEAGIDCTVMTSETKGTVVVSAAAADEARAILADLEAAGPMSLDPGDEEWAQELPPVELFNAETDRTLGHVNDDVIEWLLAQLDPDDEGVEDLEITPDVLEALTNAGGDPGLIGILREGLGKRRQIRVRWSMS
jgi:hypothetical protein